MLRKDSFLTSCIMHDYLEGCVQYEMSSEGILTVNAINNAVCSLPLMGLNARNGPAPITALASSDYSLKQTGLFIIVAFCL